MADQTPDVCPRCDECDPSFICWANPKQCRKPEAAKVSMPPPGGADELAALCDTIDGLARKATPGRREVVNTTYKCYVRVDDRTNLCVVADWRLAPGYVPTPHPDAVFIAATDPATLTRLTAAVRSLTAERDAARTELERWRVWTAKQIGFDHVTTTKTDLVMRIDIDNELLGMAVRIDRLNADLAAARGRAEVAEASLIEQSWDAVEQGCLDTYGGGYRGNDAKWEIFRHGMQTIFNVVRANYRCIPLRNSPAKGQAGA